MALAAQARVPERAASSASVAAAEALAVPVPARAMAVSSSPAAVLEQLASPAGGARLREGEEVPGVEGDAPVQLLQGLGVSRPAT